MILTTNFQCDYTWAAHAGVVDMGSNSSVGNWAAARDLDVTTLVMRGATRYPPETGRLRPLYKACFDTVQVRRRLLIIEVLL
jgi:hypothetical protein